MVGLKRKFAIEVEDYDEKEVLLDEIFRKSKVPNSELFALDADLVVQLLSSFEGKQVFPKEISKEEVFTAATAEQQVKADWGSSISPTLFVCKNRLLLNKKYKQSIMASMIMHTKNLKPLYE